MEINLLISLNDNIRIDREKCNACGRCVEVCVLDNLRLQLSPCRQACPIGMNCQEYVRLLSQGKFEKGLEVIRETVPFGGILGRICSRPCEAACNRIKVDKQPVAIRGLKRFLTENNGDAWMPEIHQHLPQKIAIIGAGPAGLTAAYFLRIQGFQVTLFDRESAPGGMLRWAIPEFRLPVKILERDLKFIQHLNIHFLGGHTLGGNLSLKELLQEYDAILLALGAHGKTKLGIRGEESHHVFPVLEFMKKVRQNDSPQIGKRVVVIGGGNAAVDAAQTALRLGAQKVRLVSLEKRDEMPAFAWSIAEAKEEGIHIENGWGPSRLHHQKKKLTGITFKKCTTIYDSKGRFSPMYDDQTMIDLPADTVIVAIGQRPELDGIDPALLGTSGISYDPITYQTSNPKIFSAGDVNRGPMTVVEAMAQGKEAALSILRFLEGEDLNYGRGGGGPYECQFEPDLSRAKPRPRVVASSLPISRRKGFQEVVRSYTKKEALAEAERCLNCGVPFGLRTCWFCLPCEIECPEKALYVEIPYLLR